MKLLINSQTSIVEVWEWIRSSIPHFTGHVIIYPGQDLSQCIWVKGIPPSTSKETPPVSDPGMHHGTCVTHVPWCMSGSLTRGGEENVPGISGACATRNFLYLAIGSASLARSIRIRFHFRHRTGRIRSVSDHRAGRVWRSRHRSKTPNCLPGARDQVPALFRNAIERRGASVDSNSGAPITQSTFNMLRRMANLLSLLNWWLHRYDNEDDYALFQV